MAKRILSLVAALLAVALLVTGCSSGSDTDSSTAARYITSNAKKITGVVENLDLVYLDPSSDIDEQGEYSITTVDPTTLQVVASPVVTGDNVFVLRAAAATEMSTPGGLDDLAIQIVNEFNNERHTLSDGRVIQIELIRATSGVISRIIQKHGFGEQSGFDFVITTTGMWYSVMNNSGQRQIELLGSGLVDNIALFAIENTLLAQIAEASGVEASELTADTVVETIGTGKVTDVRITMSNPESSSTGAEACYIFGPYMDTFVRLIGKNLPSTTAVLAAGAAARSANFLPLEWQAYRQRTDLGNFTPIIIESGVPHSGYVWCDKYADSAIKEGAQLLIAAFQSERGQKLARERHFDAPMPDVPDISVDGINTPTVLSLYQRRAANLSQIDICLGIDVSTSMSELTEGTDGVMIRPLSAVADGLRAAARSFDQYAGSGMSLGIWLIGESITCVIPLSPVTELTSASLYDLATYLDTYSQRNTTRMADALTIMADALISYKADRETAADTTIIQKMVLISDCKDEPGVFKPAISFSEVVKYISDPALGIQRRPVAMVTKNFDQAALDLIAPGDAIDGSSQSLPTAGQLADAVYNALTNLYSQ